MAEMRRARSFRGAPGNVFVRSSWRAGRGPLMLREERLGKSGEGGVEEESEEGGEERKGGGSVTV